MILFWSGFDDHNDAPLLLLVKTQLISVIASRAVDDAEPFCSNYSVSIRLMARPLSSPLIGQVMSALASD